jgi:DNA-directed RNA polymerase beta subunit
MAFIGSIVGGFAAQQIGKYNAALYNQQAAYAKQQAVMREKVYENLDRPRLLKKQSSDYSNFFVSLLTSGVEFKGTAYEAALEFQVNQALDLSIADYNQKMENIDSVNQSILLAAKARGEIYKGRMTATTEYVKAGGSLLSGANQWVNQ